MGGCICRVRFSSTKQNLGFPKFRLFRNSIFANAGHQAPNDAPNFAPNGTPNERPKRPPKTSSVCVPKRRPQRSPQTSARTDAPSGRRAKTEQFGTRTRGGGKCVIYQVKMCKNQLGTRFRDKDGQRPEISGQGLWEEENV